MSTTQSPLQGNTDADPTPRPKILKLPTGVVNKIAAGEVIERPASVVKELMENSIDAGSTRIDVLIEKGGTDLIRISDNGCGIDQEQLPLAIESHATSKIRDADDLFDVATMGFRGEALASISEVSQFLLRSFATDGDSGYEISVNGGHVGEILPCGCPKGTVIEVRNLFFNTPVRRKFLKTTQTEVGHVSEAFTRIALAFPHIHFTLTHNTRCIHDLPPTNDITDRILAFFGPEIRSALIPISSEHEGIRIEGYAVDPNQSRSHTRMQYLFLNGRHIRDKALQHALREAYRGLLLHGRYPIAFLNLEMPADQIDVNVHPAKLEVRFQESGRIYSQLLGTLRNRFLSTDLKSRIEKPDEQAGTPEFQKFPENHSSLLNSALSSQPGNSAPFQLRDAQHSQAAPPNEQQGSLDFPVERPSVWGAGQSNPGPAQLPPQGYQAPVPPTDHGEPRFSDSPNPPQSPTAIDAQGNSFHTGQQPGYPQMGHQADYPQSHQPPSQIDRFNRSGAIQIHNRYLVAESEDGVEIIDQHALHERILYEQMREKILSGKLETQRLLVPEPVQLSPSEAAAALEAKDEFQKIGIEIEPFGGDTILITSYPAMLAQRGPAELLRRMIEEFIAGSTPERRDTIDELLHMMSCKAAVKAGDKLTPEEITVLLENRDLCQDSHHCPHGRPTALIFSREELDRRFKRI